jgi:hypothetical protein
MNYSFRHLDPSTTKVYRSTVLYNFETSTKCLMLRVTNGYVVETPTGHPNECWIRGQHIETLGPYFEHIKPIRIISDGY